MSCCEQKVFVTATGEDIEWVLTDNGAGGEWKGTPSSIEFNIANDAQCGGSATNPQKGTAIMDFSTDVEEIIVLSMHGKAEAEYETFELFFNGASLVTVQASDSPKCEVSSCNMCDVAMSEREFVLPPGQHNIKITVDTMDGFYHHDAYFKIDFKIKAKENPCNTCKCTPLGILIFLRRSSDSSYFYYI